MEAGEESHCHDTSEVKMAMAAAVADLTRIPTLRRRVLGHLDSRTTTFVCFVLCFIVFPLLVFCFFIESAKRLPPHPCGSRHVPLESDSVESSGV